MARLGLMLYTVRDECARDFEGTIREVGAMGFDGVELVDLYDHEPEHVARWLRDAGLVACGRHVLLETIESGLPELAAEADAIGWRRLVVAWVEPSQLDGALVRRLKAASAAAREHGLELGFHNHDAEVQPRADGTSFLDELLDDGPVFLELDLGWAWYAGADPVSLLRRARGRCPLVHVKDFRAREPGAFVPVGDGAVGYGRVSPAAVAAGAEWLLVEQDESEGSSLDAARRSLGALRRMLAEAAA